jgi:hypothetical protein
MNVTQQPSSSVVWIRTGVVVGLVGCVVYPTIIFLHLPKLTLVVLAATLGPLLAITSLSLGTLLQLPRPSVPAQLGMIFNLAAGVLVSAVLLVQLAVKAELHGASVPREVVGIWLGLDVVFDVFASIGTGLFALSMLHHPRFGMVFGGIGLILAAGLLALNLLTFPTPPADAHLFDLGPFVCLWYLLAILQTGRSLRWARAIVSAGVEEARP